MRFRRKHGVSYLYLPEHLLALLGNYLNQYHLHLQFINAVFSAAGDLRLDEAARLEYEAYTKEEYRVLSGGLPAKLERGDQFQVTYTYFPKCFADPEVTCTTSAPEVIFARGNTLLASNAEYKEIYDSQMEAAKQKAELEKEINKGEVTE